MIIENRNNSVRADKIIEEWCDACQTENPPTLARWNRREVARYAARLKRWHDARLKNLPVAVKVIEFNISFCDLDRQKVLAAVDVPSGTFTIYE